MKRSKFSEQQIAFILRQAEDGTSVEELCRKAGISLQTYYRCRKRSCPDTWCKSLASYAVSGG